MKISEEEGQFIMTLEQLVINIEKCIIIMITIIIIEIIIFQLGRATTIYPQHSREEAVNMLRELSGRPHQVVSAVTFRTAERECSTTDVTTVYVSPLDDEEISYYIDTYKPFDKAGGYGIQEWLGYASMGHIEGSFYNVMGFPVHKVWELLQDFA